ncbi:MAG: hypothetical protein O4965_08405, partial [Trichodesmium sp. St19_bin1]|nr:hypothetical protein [Trichodesmium sp. St19_bin1]
GQTLGLVGGDIFLRGGNLTSIGGRVELGSVHNGVVGIRKDQTLSYDPNLKFGQIQISSESSIDVSGNGRVEFQIQGEEIKVRDASIITGEIKGEGEKGGNSIIKASKSIKIEAGEGVPYELTQRSRNSPTEPSKFDFNKTNSAIILTTFGKRDVGELKVETESLTLQDGAFISTTTSGQGNAGNITVSSRDIEMNGGGFFTTFVSVTFAKGNAGNLTLKAAESLTLHDAFISTGSFGSGQGNAGNLTVSANAIEINAVADRPAGLSAQTDGKGKGGNLTLKAAESLTLQDDMDPGAFGAVISTSTFGDGDAGNLTVSARDIEMSGASGLFAQTKGKGKGGNFTLKAAESLTLHNIAVISTSTFGDGDAGNLTVSARDIETSGESGLFTQTLGKGKGGNFTLKAAESLTLHNIAEISTTTFGDGDAGNLTVSARDIEMSGKSGLSVFTQTESKGNAGNLTVSARDIEMSGASGLFAQTKGKGNAGDLTINSNNIRLENEAKLTAETKVGDKGSITINNNKDLILRNNSSITTNSEGTATGGNITINTENLVAPDNSDISANAVEAFGGRVNITAAGIFGTEFRTEATDKSDITATSELGASFSGEVNINTPDVDPSDGLVEFEDTIPDISNLLNQNPCRQGQNSKFIITGRGGLPPTLEEPLAPTYLWQDSETSVTPPPAITPNSQEFIEAQGWSSNSQGIELITDPEIATPTSPWLIPPNCKQLDAFEPPPYLLASSNGNIPTSTSEPLKVTIKQFNFEGNTKFSNQELQQELTPYLNKPITFAQLIAARTAITKYYTKNNYVTSGAFIPPQTMADNGTVTLRVVEGKVGEINVKIQGRLN